MANGSLKVLHVDDEPDVADLTASFLERENDQFTVHTATSATEALTQLDDHAETIDCIVSDYDMPGMNGIEFLTAVRDRHSDMPFILFTGKGSEEIASDAISAGVTDYLQKASGTDQYTVLANRIQNAVSEYRTQQKLDATRERMKFALEATDSIVFEVDLETGDDTHHGPFEELYGVPREQIATYEDFNEHCVHPDDRDRINQYQHPEPHPDSGDTVEFEFRTHPDNGDIRWMQTEAYIDTDGSGVPQRLIGIDTDVTGRKRREREVEQSHELVEALSTTFPDYTFIYSKEGEYLDVITGWEGETSLYTPDELIGKQIDEVLSTPTAERLHATIQETIETGDLQTIEYPVQTPGGTYWHEANLAPLPASYGGEPAVVVSARDITDRKRQEDHLTALAESFPDLAFVIDEQGHTVESLASADSDELLVTEEEVVGRQLHDIMPEKHADEHLAVIQQTIETGETHTHEYQMDVKAGSRWFEARVTPLRTQIGGNQAVTWVTRDITERKAYERKLTALHEVADELASAKSIEAVCERTIEASEDILAFDVSLISTEDGGVLSPEAISGDTPRDGIADMPVEEGIAGKTYQTGKSFLIDDLEAREDATPQGPYKSLISIPIGDHGNFQAVANTTEAFSDSDLELAELLISHTTSALDRLTREQELRHQNERLEAFASVVSHDLRNPLNVAQGRLDLAREECASGHLDDAARAVDRSLTLIDDLLTLAHEGDAVGEVEAVSLAEMSNGCWQTIASTNATLTVEADPMIQADPSRLKQLLENLFQNAIKHAGTDVTITVDELAEGFYVADDGPGIPEDERDRVFETGYSTAREGSGLGLNIVREIAEAHGWDITVTESEAGGARFEITGVECAE